MHVWNVRLWRNDLSLSVPWYTSSSSCCCLCCSTDYLLSGLRQWTVGNALPPVLFTSLSLFSFLCISSTEKKLNGHDHWLTDLEPNTRQQLPQTPICRRRVWAPTCARRPSYPNFFLTLLFLHLCSYPPESTLKDYWSPSIYDCFWLTRHTLLPNCLGPSFFKVLFFFLTTTFCRAQHSHWAELVLFTVLSSFCAPSPPLPAIFLYIYLFSHHRVLPSANFPCLSFPFLSLSFFTAFRLSELHSLYSWQSPRFMFIRTYCSIATTTLGSHLYSPILPLACSHSSSISLSALGN